MLGLETARLGAQLHDGDAGGIVDVDRRPAQPVRRLDEPVPFLGVQLSGAQARGIDAAFRAEHALHELFLAHFQREKGYLSAVQSDIRRNVQRKRGLSHGRAGRHKNEIRFCRPEVSLSRSLKPQLRPVRPPFDS